MDLERYRTDPGYRAQVEGGRKGGKSKSRKKVASSRRNVAKSRGGPRLDGLPSGWEKQGLTYAQAVQLARDLKEEKANREWEAWTVKALLSYETEAGHSRDREAEAHMERLLPGCESYRREFRAWCEAGKPAGGIGKPAYALLARARLAMAREDKRDRERDPLDGFKI